MQTTNYKMMKSFGFGYEAAANANTKQQYIAILKPIVIVGVQMSVSFCLLKATSWTENTHSEVLAYAHAPPRDLPEIGLVTSDDHPAGQPIDSGCLAALILKSWLTSPTQTGQYSANVTNMGLSIPVYAGEQITLRMSHDGNPGDMELQGVIFYDDAG
jgi:hypothetical protein